MIVPQTQRQWVLQGTQGVDSLQFQQQAPVPSIGEREVLVQIHAVSLNFRDCLLAKGLYPFPANDGVVPLADGAGVVAAIGSGVERFKVGDRVIGLFTPDHLDGPPRGEYLSNLLGASRDGVLREFTTFSQESLVSAPSNLSLVEAASLPCAAVTAWNALYPYNDRPLKMGDTVLTEGTGGVSVFALQFARAAGARVIATTSSDEKAQRLKALGANHVLNYKAEAQWGEIAKSLTPNKDGVDLVVEVGGPASTQQAIHALKSLGTIAMVGSIGGYTGREEVTGTPTLLDTLLGMCSVRGVAVGSRRQFEDMNHAIEANDIHPVLDERIFKFEEAKEAYEHLWEQKHFGKVIVQIV